MLATNHRISRAATCEEWDEDAQTTLPDTRTSANVAAKRSKPELVTVKSRSRGSTKGDTEKMSRASTNGRDDGSVKREKKSNVLKLETSFPERESRLYSSGPPPERHPRSTSRPSAKRSISKVEKPEPFIRHRPGECMLCDANGHHSTLPAEPSARPREISIPQSPLTTTNEQSQPAPRPTKAAEATAAQPRPTRSQSYRGPRPMTFHAGMSQEAYHPLSSLSTSAPPWNMPPTPMSPYPQTPFAQTPPMAFPPSYQDYQQSYQMPNSQQSQHPPRESPLEPYRGSSARGEPVIRQSMVFEHQPALTRTTSQRDNGLSRESSRSRDEDARRMPPPQGIPSARRPNITKANTSASTPVAASRERTLNNQRSVPAQSLFKDRKSDPPPSSYREPPPSAYQTSLYDRPAPRKTVSYVDEKGVTKVSSSVPPDFTRRSSISNTERYEIEAEAYQQSHGTNPQALTVDAVRKISRHSDSGSQRSINSSSRGSSGGKTKTTAASTDITMIVNGVTLGISGDSAENHSIKIQPKRNGGVNINIDEEHPGARENKVMSLQKRESSATSSSKQSRRNSEKGVRRSRDASLDRDRHRASKESSRSREPSFDDSPGYGFAYG
jgi:hypothetical protein